jgi:hypothetical protein
MRRQPRESPAAEPHVRTVSTLATPILLPASDSEDALVDAIGAATAGDAPLHLAPGVHFTKPGRRT